MRVRVDAILGDAQWEYGTFQRRTQHHVDVITTERPKIGEVIEAPMAVLFDEDSYIARRKIAEQTFGGEAYLVVGLRMPPSRPT